MPKSLPEEARSTRHHQGALDGAVSAPDLSSKQKPKNRSIRDVKQAQNIITTLETAGRERNKKNARIEAKYNSERPYSGGSLEAEGLGWKSNFTTKPLPMLIDKVAPRFTQAIDGVKYLTNSSLPEEVEGAAKKSEVFRKEITSTIRSHQDWATFCADLAKENALFGFAGAAWLDEFHWMPKFFRQDHFFVPTGTKQKPTSSQVVVLRETFLIHELFSLIDDRESAETRGWNLSNTVEAINEAMPEDRKSSFSGWERVYEDLVRESNVGLSHEAGARVVSVWHLLATEIDGKVSHYILQDVSFKELFTSEDQFDSMSDATAFFTFEHGNGTLHGSKGIGRQLYAIAGILDRSRNEVVDRLNLAGKLIIQADDKALRRFKMSVVGNTILIGQGYQISERKLEANVEPFLKLDQFLTSLLDQMAGATTPKAFEGDRVTKAQVDFFAARQDETRDVIIARFLVQFARLVGTMQRRLCDPNTGEDDAKEMQKRLLLVMSKEEMKQLAEQGVVETVLDYTEQKRQQIVSIASEARGNPLYNQRKLEERKLTALIDEDFAKDVLLPEEDPTVLAEQSRLQSLELLLIAGQGAEVPVSPRDNHIVHLQVLLPAMEATAQSAVKDPQAVEILQAMLAHAEAHVQTALQTGTTEQELAEPMNVVTQLRAGLAELQSSADQQKQLAETGQLPPA